MKKSKTLLGLANIVELNKRVLTKVVGDDLSTRVEGESVADNAEVLIVSKLREKLAIKGA